MGGVCGKPKNTKSPLRTAEVKNLDRVTLKNTNEFEVISLGKLFNLMAIDQNSKVLKKGKGSDYEIFVLREQTDRVFHFMGCVTVIESSKLVEK